MKNIIKNTKLLLWAFYQIVLNILIVILLLGMVATFVNVAMANVAHAAEVEISTGRSKTKPAPNGVWKQDGFAYTQNLYADTNRIALTGRPFPRAQWLKAQIDYTDFGRINGNLQFVSDENYSGSSSDPCRSPCEVLRSADWYAESKGVGFSLLPTWEVTNWLEVYGRAGRLFYHSKTVVTALNFHDAYVVDPNPSIGIYEMKKNGSSWYYGGGVKVRPWKYVSLSLDYAHAPYLISGKDGVPRGTKTITGGIVFNYNF